MRNIKHIVIHCTATIENITYTARDINRWHKKRGWNGIGYHFVIGLDGKIEKGRPLDKIGAHVKGYNKESIGIVYVGGLDKNKRPKDTRTPEQKQAIIKLLKELKKDHTEAVVLGHRDFSPDLNGNGIIEPFEYMKSCPCFDAKEEYKYLSL